MDNMGSYPQSQWPGWQYNGAPNAFAGYTQLPSYTTYLSESMDIYNNQQNHLIHHQQMARTTESKPRLSKEEVEILEAEFQKNHKPNSSTKKALAEQMRVDNARINNWFQNRRAREKKEKNIREYAARQKMEKENSATTAGHNLGNDRHNDRVVSSAPFPDTRRPSIKSESIEQSLMADFATPEHDSETSQSDACSSPDVSAHATPDRALSFDSLDAKDYMSFKQQSHSHSAFMPGSSNGFSQAQGANMSFANYNQYPQLVMPNDEGEVTPSYSQQCFNGTGGLSPNSAQDSYSQYSESDFDDNSLINASDASLRSPASMDIASRRNRRPPHLALNASRSYSACGPRTGLDMGRRGDIGSSMRRVASATGTVRISKSTGAPRSPFFEGNTEALFELNRSPSFTAATATIAPPTPNTPVVSNQPGSSDMNPSSALVGDEKMTSDLIARDPTLRTPPTTPGIVDTMFALSSGYEGPVPDEPLATPGLGSFPSDFEVPGVSNNVPNYITNGCGSQPQTPSYTTPPMGPNYYGLPGGNAEYNWSDASVSAKSSPGQSHRQVHFMNMTPSSFTHVEK